MRYRLRFTVSLVCLLALLAVAAGWAAQAQEATVEEQQTTPPIESQAETPPEHSEREKKALAGSWFCGNTGSVASIKTLQAFTADGRAFTTGQGDIVPPVLSPQFGSWEHLFGRTYAITLLSIVYDPQGPPPAGTFLGTAKINETVTLDQSGDKFKGHFKFVQLDPAGKVQFTNEGTFQCARIKVAPRE